MSVPTQRQTLTLDDGHAIHYTTLGDTSSNKPILVFIVGSVDLGTFYHRLATHLSPHFVCVYFNRRGFTETVPARERTPETSPSKLIPQQASDAATLIEALKGQAVSPIYCFATSFGATIALEVLLSHPDLVKSVILHEPILPTLLPDTAPERQRIMRAFDEMQVSTEPFNLLVTVLLGEQSAAATKGNDFWSRAPPGNFRHAVREALAANLYQPNVGDIQRVAGKIVLMASVESKGLPVYSMVETLSRLLPIQRREIHDMVGAHFSFVSGKLAKDAAACVLDALGMEGGSSEKSKI